MGVWGKFDYSIISKMVTDKSDNLACRLSLGLTNYFSQHKSSFN